MPEFIELTQADHAKDKDGKITVNIEDISNISRCSVGSAKTEIILRSDPPDSSCWRFEESYESIKETLRIRGFNVFTVLSVEDTVPVSKRVKEASPDGYH